jgi:hypothetical protein
MQGADERTTAPVDNTLQRLAEEQGLLELSDSSLDEWLPESVLEEYCSKVLRDCRKLLTNLDLYGTVLQDEGMTGRHREEAVSVRRRGMLQAPTTSTVTPCMPRNSVVRLDQDA